MVRPSRADEPAPFSARMHAPLEVMEENLVIVAFEKWVIDLEAQRRVDFGLADDDWDVATQIEY